MWLACNHKPFYPEIVECYSQQEAEKVCKDWEEFFYDEEGYNVVITYVCEVKSTKRTRSYC